MMFQDFATIAKRFLMADYPYTASVNSIGALSKKSLHMIRARRSGGATDVFCSVVLYVVRHVSDLRFVISPSLVDVWR